MKIVFWLLCTLPMLAHELDNQTLQNLSAMPSIHRDGIGIVKVPLLIASEATLEGYGRIVRDYEAEEVLLESWPLSGTRRLFEGTGKGTVVEGSFKMYRRGNILYAENHALDRFYITGWFDDPADGDESAQPMDLSSVYTHEANYHPDGGQVFFPKDQKPFVALLALPGDAVTPEDFVAFYFDGTFGVQIFPNIWHQPMFPASDAQSFYDKQGSIHGCVGVDFIEEFGVYLEIPLRPN